jgi:protein SCO1/2
LGPDLLGVTEKRDPAWLARWLKEPDQMLAEKDSIALELFARYNELAMPNLSLNDIDVAALIDYLASASRDVDSENTTAVRRIPTAETAAGSHHENHRRHDQTQQE